MEDFLCGEPLKVRFGRAGREMRRLSSMSGSDPGGDIGRLADSP